MEKKLSSTTIEYEYITVFIDDIENIYEVLKSNSDTVSLCIDDYILSGIEEIEQVKQNFAKELEISISKPVNINVRINQYGGKIYSNKPDAQTQFTIFTLSKIFEKRQNTFYNFISKRGFRFFCFPFLYR